MTMTLGAMFFHNVSQVKAYSPREGFVSLQITHGTPSRTDALELYDTHLAPLLEMFPAPDEDQWWRGSSSHPSFHSPTLKSVTPERIEFEEFSIRFLS